MRLPGNRSLRSLLRIVIALLPLASVPALVHLIGRGRVNLGGGEKDLVWSLPWLLWSVLFAGRSFVFWRRGWPALPASAWSAVAGLVGLFVAAGLLALLGQLDVGGRF